MTSPLLRFFKGRFPPASCFMLIKRRAKLTRYGGGGEDEKEKFDFVFLNTHLHTPTITDIISTILAFLPFAWSGKSCFLPPRSKVQSVDEGHKEMHGHRSIMPRSCGWRKRERRRQREPWSNYRIKRNVKILPFFKNSQNFLQAATQRKTSFFAPSLFDNALSPFLSPLLKRQWFQPIHLHPFLPPPSFFLCFGIHPRQEW